MGDHGAFAINFRFLVIETFSEIFDYDSGATNNYTEICFGNFFHPMTKTCQHVPTDVCTHIKERRRNN